VSDVVTLPPTRHNRALEAEDLKRLLDAITVVGTPLTRLAIRLLLLTSVRTIELRRATWKEIDLKLGLWAISTTINAALMRAGFNYDRLFRTHGACGTFSTWAHEQGFSPLAIERQLAHVDRNRVKRAYNKAEFLLERKKLKQAWDVP
jgi:integrase